MNIPGLDRQIENIYAFGRNYVEHAKELGNEPPEEPFFFMKPTTSVIYSGETLWLPAGQGEIHHELEIVLAIGKRAHHVSEAEATTCIAGFGIGIDVTARAVQDQLKKSGRPWALAKGFDTFCPLGEFVPAAQVTGVSQLEAKLWVNDEVRQICDPKKMIFSFTHLIHWISQFIPLVPGDLLFTGTPKGVGVLCAGDRVRAEMGVLSKLEFTVGQR